MSRTGETWVVLGASSSVARSFARAVAEQGAAVVLAGRDREDLDRLAGDLVARGAAGVRVETFDVSDWADHAPFVARCVTAGGRLNLFVAIGVMPEQSAIDVDPNLVRTVFDTNVSGIAALLLRFSPALEAQKAGLVIALGSVAGDRGRLKNYVYGAAKAGLHAFLQGYRARLHRSGVTVMTVKPGFLDTAMTWSLGPLPMALKPDAFAAAVLKAADKRHDVVYIPGLWRPIMTVIRGVPERVFKKTNI